MVNKYILCEICFENEETRDSALIKLSSNNCMEEVRNHEEFHKRQLAAVGLSKELFCKPATVSEILGDEKDSRGQLARERLENSRQQMMIDLTDEPDGSGESSNNWNSKKQIPRPVFTHFRPQPEYANRIDKHCYTLLKSIREGKSVRCAVCGGFLTVVHRNEGIEVKYAVQHAYKHLGPTFYICNICQYQASTETVIKKHLHGEHSLSGRNDNYKISSSKSEDEVFEMITNCYGKKYEKSDFCEIMID